VSKVVLVRNSGGTITQFGSQNATAGQTEFNFDVLAPDSGNVDEFYAFAVTKLLPLDLFSLELARAVGRDASVSITSRHASSTAYATGSASTTPAISCVDEDGGEPQEFSGPGVFSTSVSASASAAGAGGSCPPASGNYSAQASAARSHNASVSGGALTASSSITENVQTSASGDGSAQGIAGSGQTIDIAVSGSGSVTCSGSFPANLTGPDVNRFVAVQAAGELADASNPSFSVVLGAGTYSINFSYKTNVNGQVSTTVGGPMSATCST